MTRFAAILTSALFLTGVAGAQFTATDAGPIDSFGPAGDPNNGMFTYNYAGTDFVPGELTFYGEATSGDVGSWLSELSWLITNPAGEQVSFGPGSGTTWTGTEIIGPDTYVGLQSFFTGTSVGTWTFEAYESYDDAGLDAYWNNVSFQIDEYVPPTPSMWPGEVEGFETGVPPMSHPSNNGAWSVISTSGHTGTDTWYQETYSPAEGANYASVQYDAELVPQDVTLLSPIATAVAGMELSGQTSGSIYWGTKPEQGGTFDNYDGEVWIVRGGTLGDGDDTFIGLLDDFWVSSFVWESFSYNLDDYGLVAGEDFQIGFRYVGLDGAQLNLDGVLLTPEPSSIMLLALAGLGLIRRR